MWKMVCCAFASNCSIIDRIASCKTFLFAIENQAFTLTFFFSFQTSLTHSSGLFSSQWLHRRDREWDRHSISKHILNSFMIKFSFSRCHERIYRFESSRDVSSVFPLNSLFESFLAHRQSTTTAFYT